MYEDEEKETVFEGIPEGVPAAACLNISLEDWITKRIAELEPVFCKDGMIDVDKSVQISVNYEDLLALRHINYYLDYK